MRTITNIANRPAGDRHGARPLLVAFVVASVLGVGACGSDGPLADIELPTSTTVDGSGGGSTTAPDTETTTAETETTAAETETTAPETAAPVEPEPGDGATTEPDGEIAAPDEGTTSETSPPVEAEPDDDGGLSSDDLLLLALVVGVIVAIVLIGAGVASSRSRAKDAQRSAHRAQLAELVGGLRWVHDEGSMEILRTSDPAQLNRSWQVTNARIVELEGRANAMRLAAGGDESAVALDAIGRAAATLRAALNADVSLRSDPAMAERADLVQASAQTVQLRRNDLDAALSDPALQVR